MSSAQEPKPCGRTHTFDYHGEEETKKSKQVNDAELDAIIDRLYHTQTKARQGGQGQEDEGDGTKKQGKTSAEVDKIVERLYTMKTEAMKERKEEEKSQGKAMKAGDVDNIVERLYTTHTASSSGDAKAPKPKNVIARKPESEDEIKEIYARLLATHTKSSAGGKECRSYEPLKLQGLGLKMLPIIEGLETRFKGMHLSEAEAEEIMSRLLNTHTGASKARRDFPHVLLYPERTILHNNTTRIKSYQANGAMSKQKELARREKWFN